MSDLWSWMDLEDAAEQSLKSSVALSGLSLNFDPSTTSSTSPGIAIARTEPWAAQPPNPIQEIKQVANSNSKAYRVVFTDGSERVIEATDVSESSGRLRFMGVVEGYPNSHGANSNDVIASFLADNIAEYGVVPVPEEVLVGANTYRVTFAGTSGAGDSKDIVADRVMFTQSGEKGGGQYTLTTKMRGGAADRTEFVINERNVFSINRVTDSGEDPVVPAQTVADAAKAHLAKGVELTAPSA